MDWHSAAAHGRWLSQCGWFAGTIPLLGSAVSTGTIPRGSAVSWVDGQSVLSHGTWDVVLSCGCCFSWAGSQRKRGQPIASCTGGKYRHGVRSTVLPYGEEGKHEMG